MAHATQYFSGRFERPPRTPSPATRPSTAPVDGAAMSLDGAAGKHNQDRFLLRYPIFIIADGVGAQPGGDHAADTAVREAARHANHIAGLARAGRAGNDAEMTGALLRIPARCRDALRADAAANPALAHMATTLTLVLIHWPTAHVVWAGDSPCYLVRHGNLIALTDDQPAVRTGEEADAGAEPQASRPRQRQSLLSAVSADRVARARRLQLRPGDAVLLCTDGITAAVPDAQLVRIVERAASASEACAWLTMAVREVGSGHDATAVVVRFLARTGHVSQS
jgi:PPM family protein phosphatase